MVVIGPPTFMRNHPHAKAVLAQIEKINCYEEVRR
jgi:hypothetical protein